MQKLFSLNASIFFEDSKGHIPEYIPKNLNGRNVPVIDLTSG